MQDTNPEDSIKGPEMTLTEFSRLGGRSGKGKSKTRSRDHYTKTLPEARRKAKLKREQEKREGS